MNNKANRSEVFENIMMLILLTSFWGTLGLQCAGITKLMILTAIIYTLVNLIINYRLFRKKFKKFSP